MAEATSTVEIIEQPFDGGNDFFKPAGEQRHTEQRDDALFPVDEPEEEDELNGDITEEGATSSALDPAIDERLRALEEENAAMKAATAAQQAAAQVASLMDQYDQAVAESNYDKARQIRQQVVQAQAKQAGAAAGGGSSGVPLNHWSKDVARHINEWQAKQPWLGVDVKKTQAVKEAGNVLNPTKFATPEAYFKAIEAAITETVKPTSQSPRPVPRTAAVQRVAAPTGEAAAKGVTSIRQLPAHVRSAAETAMRIGGLTEAQYLASYNAVQASQSKRTRRK